MRSGRQIMFAALVFLGGGMALTGFFENNWRVCLVGCAIAWIFWEKFKSGGATGG